MKTHPITDHVPEAELLEITRDGAARWLLRHEWEWDGACMVTGNAAQPYVVMPRDELEDRVRRTVNMVVTVAVHHRMSPRTIIAEMQADSRIVAELQRMAAKKAAGPTIQRD